MKHPLAPVGGILAALAVVALVIIGFPLVVAVALIAGLLRGME